MVNPLPSISILGVRIHQITEEEAVQRTKEFLRSTKQHMIVTVNAEFIMEAQRSPIFRRLLNEADLSIPDGFGPRLVAWLQRTPLKGRVTGVDLSWRIASLAEQTGARLFLFGARHDVARRAARALIERYPKLTIVGAENEFSALGHRRAEEEVIKRIRRRKPDVLLVALGAPKQELWIAQHLHQLPSVKLAIGVGGTLDYMAGVVRRAPLVFRGIGLEWLWRLMIEPFRWKRVLNATILFPITFFRERR